MRVILFIVCLFCFSSNTLAAIIEGNSSGKVTLIEVYDYQCIYCHLDYKNVLALIDNNPDLQVRLMPVAIENQLSIYEAAAAIASTKYPGKFQEFTDMTMSGEILSKSAISEALKNLQLTSTSFKKSMHSVIIEAQLNQGLKFLKLEKSNTPLFIIFPTNNAKVSAVLKGYQSKQVLQNAVSEAMRYA